MKKALTLLSICLFTFLIAPAQVNLEWASTYRYTSQEFDYGREIKIDKESNVYVGGHSLINAGQEGITTILKYDAFGNLIWEFHSAPWDYMEDMVIDNNGNIFFTGARWNSSSAEWDFLTTKVNANGSAAWSVLYDGNGIGSGWDYAWGISIDRSGNLYSTGHSQGTFNGYDWVTVKYDSSGVEQWVARYENPDNTGLQSNYDNDVFEVDADENGNVFVSGYTFNGNTHELTLLKYDNTGNLIWARDIDTRAKWPTTNINKNYMKLDRWNNIYLLSQIQSNSNSTDMMLAKYDPNGNLNWTSTWDSPSHDSDYTSGGFYVDEALAIDLNGNAIVSGVTSDRTVQFREDMITLKYDTAGNLLWSNVFNGIGNDEDRPYGLALDISGNAYLTGSSYFTSAIGDVDYITFKINGTTGIRDWSITYDGTANFSDEAHAICVDSLNNVYITGWNAINRDPFDLHGEMATIKYSQSATDIMENNSQNVLTYPNPCNEFLNIQLTEMNPVDAKIKVIDPLGKIISLPVTVRNASLLIDTQILADGIYHLKIESEKMSFKGKFSVLH